MYAVSKVKEKREPFSNNTVCRHYGSCCLFVSSDFFISSWMKILASVMNTLSETICNSYPFKARRRTSGRFCLECSGCFPLPAKERAVYIRGSCNKIPLKNLNSIGSRSVVCLHLDDQKTVILSAFVDLLGVKPIE